MKKRILFLATIFLGLGGVVQAQTAQWTNPTTSWTYGFSGGNPSTYTDITTGTTSNGDLNLSSQTTPTPFLPAPPSGIAMVFIPSGATGPYTLDPSANTLKMVASSSSENKFTAYNISGATSVAQMSFNITLDSVSGSTLPAVNYIWSIGNNGTNASSTVYINKNAIYKSPQSAQSIFTELQLLYVPAKKGYKLSYRSAGSTTGGTLTVLSDTLYGGIHYNIQAYCNNSTVAQNYIGPDGNSYTVAPGGFQLWVINGSTMTRVSTTSATPSFDIPASVETNTSTGDESILTDTQLNAFLFGSGGNAAANLYGYAIIDGGMSVSYLASAVALPGAFIQSSFKGSISSKAVLLNWSTASEQNNDHFDVLHSADGNTFNSIGQVAGNGTTSVQHDYSFTDNNPYSGTTYYKLQEVDPNGNIIYNSNIISVSDGTQVKSFTLYDQVRYSNTPSSLLPYLQPFALASQNNLLDANNLPSQSGIDSFANTCLGTAPIDMDLESWAYYPDATLTTTINNFNTVISYFKAVNNHTPIGFYGVPPKQAYQWSSIDPVNNPSGYASWKHISDSLARVAQNVDVFQPSFYTYDPDTTSWRKMVDTTIAAIKRYSKTKPIYAFIWPQYHDSTGNANPSDSSLRFIDTARWKYELRTLYDRADGVIIWSSNTDPNKNTIYWDPNMLWWQATKAFMVEKSLSQPFQMDGFTVSRTTLNKEILIWNTSVDTTTSQFIVQRSTDGTNFVSIGDPILPIQSHYTENSYRYSDTSTSGNLYYRLQIVNKNSTIQYSSVLTSKFFPPNQSNWVDSIAKWNYDFGNGTAGTYQATTGALNTTFLPKPPSGTAMVYIKSGAIGPFTLDPVGDTLKMVASNNTNKFAAYNVGGATSVARISFGITLDSTGAIDNSQTYFWSIGNSDSTGNIYSTGAAIANNSAVSRNSIFTLLKLVYNSSNHNYLMSYRGSSTSSKAFYYSLYNNTFYPSTHYTIQVFCNDSTSAQAYIAPDGSTDTVAARSFHIWTINDSTSTITRIGLSATTFDIPRTVETATNTGDLTITDNARLNAFVFQGGGNAAQNGYAIIDGGISLSFGGATAATTPVSFIPNSFKGILSGKSVLLNWATASEQNNAYFEVLRSSNGNAFNSIGKVTGNLTTSIQHNYAFFDNSPYSGMNYYKLQQVDLDGQATYNSNIVAINVAQSQQNSFNVFVSGNQLNASVNAVMAEDAVLQVFTIAGQQLLNKNIQLNQGENHFSFNIPQLQHGVFIAVLNTKTQQLSVKFIK